MISCPTSFSPKTERITLSLLCVSLSLGPQYLSAMRGMVLKGDHRHHDSKMLILPIVYTDSNGNQQVNETKYEEVGLCMVSTQLL